MGNNQKGFLLYLDNYDLIEDISNEEKGRWIDAVFRYKRYGEIPDFQKGTLLNTAFKVTKSQLDRDAEAWEEKRQKRAEAGHKGGLAKAGNSKRSQTKSSNAKQNIANLAVNVTDKVNDSVSVIDTDTDTVIETDTKHANIVSGSVDRPAGAAAAESAAPHDADLFSVKQLLATAKKNKVNLTKEGIQVFHEEMQDSGWILYGEPVEKKYIVRVLREYANKHPEYSLDQEDFEKMENEIYEIACYYINQNIFNENSSDHQYHKLIERYCPKNAFNQKQIKYIKEKWSVSLKQEDKVEIDAKSKFYEEWDP